jgi:hypothetical protein
MKLVRPGLCISLAAMLLLTIGGCGTPPETEQSSQSQQASGRPLPAMPPASRELSAVPTPQHPASAIWADEIKLLGFDIKPQGKAQAAVSYEVSVYYKALKQPSSQYMMTLHLVPTDKRVLTAEVPGTSPSRDALWWDCQPVPATTQWLPGKYYRVSNSSVVPHGGGEWAIEVGFYRVSEGKLFEVKQRTDKQGAMQTTLRTKPVAIESGS